MGKAKELRIKCIEQVAGSYFSEPNEGETYYTMYQKLCEAQNLGFGDDMASWHTDVWQGVEDMTVCDLIELIDGQVDNMEKFYQLPEFLQKMDWKLLKEQKEMLNISIENADPESNHSNGLIGILHLIDAMQDYAVDVMGMKESDILNLENDEQE